MTKLKLLSLKSKIALLAALDWLSMKIARRFSGISLSLLSLSNRAFDRKVYLRQEIEGWDNLLQLQFKSMDSIYEDYLELPTMYNRRAGSLLLNKDGITTTAEPRVKRGSTKPKSKKRTSKSKKGKSK